MIFLSSTGIYFKLCCSTSHILFIQTLNHKYAKHDIFLMSNQEIII